MRWESDSKINFLTKWTFEIRWVKKESNTFHIYKSSWYNRVEVVLGLKLTPWGQIPLQRCVWMTFQHCEAINLTLKTAKFWNSLQEVILTIHISLRLAKNQVILSDIAVADSLNCLFSEVIILWEYLQNKDCKAKRGLLCQFNRMLNPSFVRETEPVISLE